MLTRAWSGFRRCRKSAGSSERRRARCRRCPRPCPTSPPASTSASASQPARRARWMWNRSMSSDAEDHHDPVQPGDQQQHGEQHVHRRKGGCEELDHLRTLSQDSFRRPRPEPPATRNWATSLIIHPTSQPSSLHRRHEAARRPMSASVSPAQRPVKTQAAGTATNPSQQNPATKPEFAASVHWDRRVGGEETQKILPSREFVSAPRFPTGRRGRIREESLALATRTRV